MLQARLDGLIGNSSGLIETLPRPVQKRIQYLRNLQEEYNDREKEYEKELDELDQKYEKIYGLSCCHQSSRQIFYTRPLQYFAYAPNAAYPL